MSTQFRQSRARLHYRNRRRSSSIAPLGRKRPVALSVRARPAGHVPIMCGCFRTAEQPIASPCQKIKAAATPLKARAASGQYGYTPV